MNDRFSVVLTKSAKFDIADKKRYILERFKYREYAESFSASLRKQDGMDWQNIIRTWLADNE